MRDRTTSVALVLVWLLNYVDALCTLAWVKTGVAFEANPLMVTVIDTPTLFLSLKVTLVSFGCFLLWRFRASALAWPMILVALICYGAILMIHTDIALSLDHIPHEHVRFCLENLP